MNDYVALLGSESVQNAGYAMERAAESFRQTVGNLDDSLRQHQRFLDDWLERFERAVKAAEQPPKPWPPGMSPDNPLHKPLGGHPNDNPLHEETDSGKLWDR